MEKTEIQELSEFIRDNMLTRSEFYDEMARVNRTLDEHTRQLAEHSHQLAELSRDVTIIKRDVATNLDKRLQLEIRVGKLETQAAKA